MKGLIARVIGQEAIAINPPLSSWITAPVPPVPDSSWKASSVFTLTKPWGGYQSTWNINLATC
uniref:Uncharacterized protein n=1 Tax=Arundo donax TaxID=35708 RepID=A0A0A9CKI3_ARUDO